MSRREQYDAEVEPQQYDRHPDNVPASGPLPVADTSGEPIPDVIDLSGPTAARAAAHGSEVR